jgi:hypothetical protein
VSGVVEVALGGHLPGYGGGGGYRDGGGGGCCDHNVGVGVVVVVG